MSGGGCLRQVAEAGGGKKKGTAAKSAIPYLIILFFLKPRPDLFLTDRSKPYEGYRLIAEFVQGGQISRSGMGKSPLDQLNILPNPNF